MSDLNRMQSASDERKSLADDYDVRVCLKRCGYDASYQPPEVKRCPNCGGIIGAVPLSMVDEFLKGQNDRR